MLGLRLERVERLRIGIIGLGGIGGYFGTKLAGRYGKEHEIIFIQRGRHLETIKTEGLRYLTRDHQYLVHPTLATDDPAKAGRLDLSILCVKSRGLESALERYAGSLDGESVLLTAMNGVEIAERCRRALPELVILPGAIFLSAHVAKPGLVRQVGGAGNFYFGPLEGQIENYRWIESLLKGAGIKAVLDTDVRTRLWEKYLFVEPLATLTSATGLSVGQAVRGSSERRQFVGMMKEIMTLASTRGIMLPESLIEENLALAERIPPETRTSMQLDIEAGKPSELDVFTEYVVSQSGRSGVDTPLHRELFQTIKGKTVS